MKLPGQSITKPKPEIEVIAVNIFPCFWQAGKNPVIDPERFEAVDRNRGAGRGGGILDGFHGNGNEFNPFYLKS